MTRGSIYASSAVVALLALGYCCYLLARWDVIASVRSDLGPPSVNFSRLEFRRLRPIIVFRVEVGSGQGHSRPSDFAWLVFPFRDVYEISESTGEFISSGS